MMAASALWTIFYLFLLINISDGKFKMRLVKLYCMILQYYELKIIASYLFIFMFQLNNVFVVGVEVVCLFFETTEVLMIIESHAIIKPSSPATSLTVIHKCVGTSQSGGWMFVEMVLFTVSL